MFQTHRDESGFGPAFGTIAVERTKIERTEWPRLLVGRWPRGDVGLVLVLVVIAALDLLVSVVVPTIGAIGHPPLTMGVIEEDSPGGTIRTYKVQEPYGPRDEFGYRWAEYTRFLPFKHLGMFLIPFAGHLPLLATAIASIPVSLRLLRGVSLWRRIPYAYLLAASVAGFAASLWSTMGR